jgi:hypothetical protein
MVKRITFPIKMEENLSKMIDEAVFLINKETNSKISKHQYCLEAIKERVEKDLRNAK